MKNVLRIAMVCGAATLLMTGCKKTDANKISFTNAINSYYAAHPACLWDEPIKFPVQVTTSDVTKTTGYDALVDQGLLQRTTEEKKVFIIGSKQVTNYDISDKGRGEWTADATQPGFGNFCYGHRTVQSIDSVSATNGEVGTRTLVTYHSTVKGAPAWASTAETQNAFPQVHADLSGSESNSATLLNTENGWQMQTLPPLHKATDADGKIVE